MSDTLLFFRQLLNRPAQVSAIAPSSPWLARAMARGLGPQTGKVVEFGPGTGALTAGILATGVAPGDLTLFEMSSNFADHLALRFPGVTIRNTGAQNAASLMTEKAGAVISGLPLLSMPPDLRFAIVKAAFDVLRPGGTYIQFTYGPRPPITPDQIEELHLCVNSGEKVWLNLPPARVFTFRRRSEA